MPPTRARTIYFDLTTSISWGGAPVGITRVEREIAKRAHGRIAPEVRYCVFHQATEAFYELNPAFAQRVLAGECWIELDQLRGLPLHSLSLEPTKLSNVRTDEPPAAAILSLRRELAGTSLADILALREQNPLLSVNNAAGAALTAVSQVIKARIKLTPNVVIINGGLDWEHKNLRRLRELKKKTGFIYVAIIYDIIPLLYPHYVVTFYVDLLKKYFGELFWTADFALCISATTRRNVEAHMEAWRMPPIPMVDWPLGSDIENSEDANMSEAELPAAVQGRPFLLYVSTIEPRKSHRTIVDAFEHAVRTEQIDDDAVCVFVGRVGWNSENLIHEIRNNPILKDRVIILSAISDADLLQLYKTARFVVFPSRYEGYGLSLVEAMALGKACISGDAGSLREVGGDAPLYINPIDLPKWVEAIVSCFRDDDRVAALETRSRTEYKPVSWDDSADLFYGALENWLGPRS